MPYFPNLNVKYVSIPGNGSDAVTKNLLRFELFDGIPQTDETYERIIYSKKFVKNEDFKHMFLWEFHWKYPDSFGTRDLAVVRNPYDRLVAIFFDLTNTNKNFKKFKPFQGDTIKQLQMKFENFFVHFKMFKNFNEGIGIEHVELLLEQLGFPDKNKMAAKFFENWGNTRVGYDTRFSPQSDILRSDHKIHSRFFRKPETQNYNHTTIVKYEKLERGLEKFDSEIFKDFLAEYNSFRRKSGIEYPSNFFYNKISKKLVSEFYEKDFDLYHYSPEIHLVK